MDRLSNTTNQPPEWLRAMKWTKWANLRGWFDVFMKSWNLHTYVTSSIISLQPLVFPDFIFLLLFQEEEKKKQSSHAWSWWQATRQCWFKPSRRHEKKTIIIMIIYGWNDLCGCWTPCCRVYTHRPPAAAAAATGTYDKRKQGNDVTPQRGTLQTHVCSLVKHDASSTSALKKALSSKNRQRTPMASKRRRCSQRRGEKEISDCPYRQTSRWLGMAVGHGSSDCQQTAIISGALRPRGPLSPLCKAALFVRRSKACACGVCLHALGEGTVRASVTFLICSSFDRCLTPRSIRAEEAFTCGLITLCPLRLSFGSQWLRVPLL